MNIIAKCKSYFKKRKLLFYIIALAITLPVSFTLSRYVNKLVTNYYLETQKFYFTSDKLTENNSIYKIENWSGVENLAMDIQLESRLNQYEVADTDITYTVTYECEEGVICSLSKENGVIYSSTNVDKITLNLIPVKDFENGESTTVTVTAKSTSPYTKTIKATFIITVGKKGISYEIKDETYQTYLFLNITNAKSSYKVNEAFDGYTINQEIDYLEYLELSEVDKEKCTSSFISLSFNPRTVILDTTSPILSKVKEEDITTTQIDNTSFISGIKFKMDALSAEAIRFYKAEPTKNYTYPIINQTPIITLITE